MRACGFGRLRSCWTSRAQALSDPPGPWTQAVGSWASLSASAHSPAQPSTHGLCNPVSVSQPPGCLKARGWEGHLLPTGGSWPMWSPHASLLSKAATCPNCCWLHVAGIHWIPTNGAGGVGARLGVGPEPPLFPSGRRERSSSAILTGFPPPETAGASVCWGNVPLVRTLPV